MNRQRKLVLSIALAASGLLAFSGLAASPAQAASMTMVPRATWTNGVTLPSYVQMYIYVPDKMAAKPPIFVSAHACMSSASGQLGAIPMVKAAADAQGFILVFPDNPGQNCWDVGSAQSLMHDGGGDTQAIAQMVKYTLTKYSGDASRVYVQGGSSGAMLTQAMLAVYPDLFRAGAARAGVPAGCWSVNYDPSMQWSDPCAGGTVTNTAMAWGDMVRKMYPGYTGHRPRIQLMQGESDTTIHYPNMAESIKEWTNVLGLSTTPTSMDTGYKGASYTWDRQFWKNSCGYQVLEAWSAPGQNHSMSYEEAAIMTFFGLTTGSTMDPEPDCTGGGAGGGSGSGSAGTTGTGTAGTNGSGGTKGAGGSIGATDGGVTDGGATDGPSAGSGGSSGTTTGSGGVVGTGGSKAGSGGVSASGGSYAIATGGSGSGGTKAGSGGNGSGGNGSGGSSSGSGSGGSASSASGSSGGCAIAGSSGGASTLGLLLMVAAGAIVRRRRRRV